MPGTAFVAPTGAKGSYVGYASDEDEEQEVKRKTTIKQTGRKTRDDMRRILPKTPCDVHAALEPK